MQTLEERKATSNTPRQELRDWIRQEVSGQDIVSLSDLTNRAVNHFKDDEDFLRRLLDQEFRPVIYDMVQFFVGQTRSFKVSLGDETVTEREFEQRVEDKAATFRKMSRWDKWLEHVDDQHINIKAMNRSDCLVATQERTERGNRELARAAFFKKLSEELSDEETVGEKFSDEELDAMYANSVGGK